MVTTTPIRRNTGRARWLAAAILVVVIPVVVILVVVILVTTPAAAQTPAALEYQIKATFLYTMAKFVEWPPEKLEGAGPLAIGVYGKDPFGATLDQQLQGKTVDGRAIVVRRITGLEQIRQQHIIFIAAGEKKHWSAVLGAVAGGGVLTVSDTDNFAEQGGMVNLVMKGNSVGLEINVAAAERAHIKISSKLLKLARVVEGGGDH